MLRGIISLFAAGAGAWALSAADGIGAEGAGLSRLVRETCEQVVAIPLDPKTESLNASVAAGIALYEIDRQRKNV